jgi:hypothetical protein
MAVHCKLLERSVLPILLCMNMLDLHSVGSLYELSLRQIHILQAVTDSVVTFLRCCCCVRLRNDAALDLGI